MHKTEAQFHVESKNIDKKSNFEVIEYLLVRQLANHEFDSCRIILIHNMEKIMPIITIWKLKIRKNMDFIHF